LWSREAEHARTAERAAGALGVRVEIAVRRARLLAALRVIAMAREREGGLPAATGRLDRVREDITAALELLENRPERMMKGRPPRTQTRISVAPVSDRR
jgi:hypothetical protein